jgi:dihydroorotate dehydrogenase electron transfer subunit
MSQQRDQFLATVEANVALCREHYRLVLRVDRFPPTEPGQFIQISCRDVNEDHLERVVEWIDPRALPRLDEHARELVAPLALLRRPFSLAGRRDGEGGVELDIIHRVVGIGTDWMSRLKVGDRVDILGPLGNRFELPPHNGLAILVGGGVGIPPMLYLAGALKGHRAVAFCGAVSHDLLPLTITSEIEFGSAEPSMSIDEFARHGIASAITTDDGSCGFRGFVTQALEQWLEVSIGNQQWTIGDSVIYTCGPEPMMKRVADIASARGIECQVAVERAMACGMGTCQSCCIRVRKPDPSMPPLLGSEWCWRLACTDGPVFKGADLLW